MNNKDDVWSLYMATALAGVCGSPNAGMYSPEQIARRAADVADRAAIEHFKRIPEKKR